MKTNTIAIVGMRRTGTSIALALKAGRLDFILVGHDSDSALLRSEIVSQAVDRVEKDLIKACETADIVVLAMPSVELESTLDLIGDRLQEHTLIIDLTALKGRGIQLAKEHVHTGHYVGARPIFSAATFSDARASLDSASAELFRNSVFCVTPSAEADPQAVETAVKFGQLIGAKPYFVDPFEYDQLALGTETLPGIGAAALFRSVSKSAGWRDILRFADLPFAVGTQPLDVDSEELAYLLLHDRQATARWLDALLEQLSDVRRFLVEGEQEILSAYLSELNLDRQQWLKDRSANNWDEAMNEEYDLPSMSEHFLGSLASRAKGR